VELTVRTTARRRPIASDRHDLDAATERVVREALFEDLGAGDATSESLIDEDARCSATILLKEPGVVCGLTVAEAAFRALDPAVRFDPAAADGERIDRVPHELAHVEGRARAVLSAERTALNLLGRLSGVATATRRYADAVEGTGARILDTRKTTPGLRALEKHAVACGGGLNHRRGLDEAILIKDNHLRLAGGVRVAVERALAAGTGVRVQVEAESLDDVRAALVAGADSILLDNMSPVLLREAVSLAGGRAELEASGGITLDTVRAVAETGVDFVSVGALTHSARSLDVSLEVL
jgi:nicotinate-nucleotide pyrophosphorylase (carboxylating)